jgi:hypothetical protein
MKDGVKVAALAGMMIWATLAAVPTAASAGVPRLTQDQVMTCSGALQSHAVMTTKAVSTCLAVVGQTYTPSWCSNGAKGYVIDLKGRDGLRGKVASTWAIRVGAKPYKAGANYSDSAVNSAICGGAGGTSPLLEPIPASISTSWVRPPAEAPGPERVGMPNGPMLATLLNATSGQTVDGVQCQTSEKTVVHEHTHLTIYVSGQASVIPYGIGIPGLQAVQVSGGPFVETGSCFYWLHTHANDGIIHIESPSPTRQFTLGQFFEEWGVPLSSTQVGSAAGKVTVFFTAPGYKTEIYTGDPRSLPLGDHYEIQLDVGTPIVAPYKVTNWGGL